MRTNDKYSKKKYIKSQCKVQYKYDTIRIYIYIYVPLDILTIPWMMVWNVISYLY